MKGWKKTVFFLIIPVTGFLLILGGVFKEKIHPGEVALDTKEIKGVKIAKVQNDKNQSSLAVTGTIIAQEDTTISSKLMASVKSILVKKGDFVKAGQPLLLLDSSQVTANAKQAQANIQAAQAARQSADSSIQYTASGVGQAQSQVQQANAALQDAQAQFDNAKINFDRAANLYNSGAISKKDYDDSYTQYVSAKAAVDKAKANVNAAESALQQAQNAIDVARSKRGETDAQIQQASAAYESATISVNDATIRAPFDGKFIDNLVNVGDMAQPGTPLLKVEKAPYYLETYVDESKQNNIHIGDEIPVIIGATNKKVSGTVSEITPHVDPDTRKIKVKIELPSSPDILSGMFAQALIPDGKEKSILIPQSAIVRWTQFTGVYVVDDKNIAHLRFVNLGETREDMVEVLSGINVGERIVISPVDKITDRARVVEGQ